ncbi:vasoactive intestinal peptide b isoform X3 [Astyanax mexicanus]|uniref:vasoactive intestinal peptide b isoform X3 n=1 Tax=Astyanax mexicanus TaxID=7994 RepID=UPI000BBDC4C4|nr:vasoactive intestinal peptide b isoform X3 [Astyanax mexicanus]
MKSRRTGWRRRTLRNSRTALSAGQEGFSTSDSTATTIRTSLEVKKAMAWLSSGQLVLVFLCCVLCCRSTALPAISTYSAMRSGSLNGDGEGSWPVDPSQDVEVYKLLYEIANTVERPSRHADGLFTSGYSKLLGQLSAKEYLESLLSKRVSSDELDAEQMRMKRHSDAVFTDNYSRYRKQMAAKKYLNSVLAGKRSPEDALTLPNQSKSTESSLQQSYEDPVDQLLQQLPLV